jgi:hypothetical protein
MTAEIAVRSGRADLAVALLFAARRALQLVVAVVAGRARVGARAALDADLRGRAARARRILAVTVDSAWTLIVRTRRGAALAAVERDDAGGHAYVPRVVTHVPVGARARLVRDVDRVDAARRDERNDGRHDADHT